MAKRKTNRTAWGLAAILAVGVLGASGAQAKKLYPVDEAPKDRSFRVFRRELIRAARRRDRRFLISHLDPISWSIPSWVMNAFFATDGE